MLSYSYFETSRRNFKNLASTSFSKHLDDALDKTERLILYYSMA